MEVRNMNRCFAELKPDPHSDIQILKVIDGETALFAAELKPQKTLKAHYHTEGAEIYHVLEGEGVMEIGVLVDSEIKWQNKYLLKAGDVIEVPPKAVHRLSNGSRNALRLVFVTKPSHLADDRFFI
jgi:mannose-6-phosphate isomerase-like protein (cupin superfamily)